VSSEQREFFRFDVKVPYYLEPLNDKGLCLHVTRKDLISDAEYQAILKESEVLNHLFTDNQHLENGGVQVFGELNQKLEFMILLLESVLEGKDIRQTADYEQKVADNNKFSIPDAHSSAKIIPLLQAFYLHVDEYIYELMDVVAHSVHGKVFMYHKESPKAFNVEHYIRGLNAVANKGNWLAQVITLLVKKLNHYERLFSNLKQAYKSLSNVEDWPVESINLGAGGFAIYTDNGFNQHQQVCSLFKMDDEFVFAEAKCVYQAIEPDSHGRMRTAFEFANISAEDSAHIVRFLMAQELAFRNLNH